MSLTQTYSRFLLTSVDLGLGKPFELSYAKFKFLTTQVKRFLFFFKFSNLNFLLLFKINGITIKFEEVMKKILNDSAESINYLLFGGYLMKYLKDTNNSNYSSLKVNILSRL